MAPDGIVPQEVNVFEACNDRFEAVEATLVNSDVALLHCSATLCIGEWIGGLLEVTLNLLQAYCVALTLAGVILSH